MNSDMLLYATAELAALLLCICAFLIFHIRNLKKLIKRLEGKVLELRDTIAATKHNAKSKIQEIKNSFQEKTYLEYIDQQIDLTREHHASQSPDRDIVLDLDTDIPEERQITALRHAFLVMEKEAQYASEEDAAMVWPVIRTKLQQIIHFYRTAFQGENNGGGGASEADEMLLQELQNYKQRVENLDKFKKLFFDMEKQWNAARKEAEQYRAQLLEMTQGLDNAGIIEDVLNQYSNAYNALQDFMDSGADLADGGTGEVVRKRAVVEEVVDERRLPEAKVIITHQDEIVRLRKMMVEQHNIIAGLKQKLRADSNDEKLAAVEQLSRELDKQERMMRESETCIKLLEDELDQIRNQMQVLQDENNELRAGAPQQSEQEVQEMLAGHVAESRDMMTSIAKLEKENKQLREQLASGGGSAGGGMSGGDADDAAEAERLRTKLADVQQELLNLQTQHIELEERYIELKTSNIR